MMEVRDRLGCSGCRPVGEVVRVSVELVDDGFEHLFPTPEQEAAERAIVAAEVAEIRAILATSAPADWPAYLDVAR